jgi:hypothetical protein
MIPRFDRWNILPRSLRSLLKIVMSGLVVLCGTGATAVKTPTAQEVESAKALIGTWQLVVEPGEAIIVSAESKFAGDGAFASKGMFQLSSSAPIQVTFSGKWRIEGDTLIMEVTKSSPPGVLPVGVVTRDRILKLDGRSLETRTADGKTERYKKAAPAPGAK